MNFNSDLDIIIRRLHSHIRYYTLLPLVTILLVTGCRISSPQSREKDLLVKNKIQGNDAFQKYELSELYKQKPNKKILGFVSTRSAYYLGTQKKWLFFDVYNVEKLEKKIEKIEKKYDKKLEKGKKDSTKIIKRKNERIAKKRRKIKEGSWLARSVGEKPAFLDTTKIEKTKKQMATYMQSKGYFDAYVTHTIKPRYQSQENRKKIVTYIIHEGEPTLLNNITFSCANDTINKLLKKHAKETKLIEGEPFDVAHINDEKKRLFDLFRNNGYYYFKKNLLLFEADTTIGPKLMDINVRVEIPSSSKALKKYTIRDIYFRLEHPMDSEVKLDTIWDEESRIHYIKGHGKFSQKVLNKKIKFRPGETVEMNKIVQSQSLLGNIDIFKYINFNFKNAGEKELDIQIFTSPFKKYQLATEGGASVNVTQGTSLPGPFINLSFKDRNIFNGFEIFETSVRYTIQGQASATNENEFFNNREVGLNMGITTPTILFPHFLLPKKLKESMYSTNPKSRITIGYSNVERPEFNRNNVNAALNFSWQQNAAKSFVITPFELFVIDSDITDGRFRDYLEDLESRGNNLIQSFRSSFVPSMTFSYIYNDNILGSKKNGKFNRLNVEFGGVLLTALKAMNAVEERVFNLPYYQYFKISNDLRLYTDLTPKTTFVTRIYGGFAKTFGTTQALPYEKFFFAGGSNSMRAWQPRRLGPGSLPPYNEEGTDFNYSFEQPGEIILELNLEWRRNLIGFIDGAFFIDAGNVWTFELDKECDNCPEGTSDERNGQFRFNKFYKEIAVGTGVGVRLNFSIIIIRLDVGFKVYDPARSPGNKFIFLKSEDDEGIRNSPALNLGIGYPF